MSEAIKFRNKIAHGLFAFYEDGEPRLIPFPLSKGKKKDLDLTAGLVHTYVVSIGEFISQIHEITGPVDFEILKSQ